jgi:hypothetical protein
MDFIMEEYKVNIITHILPAIVGCVVMGVAVAIRDYKREVLQRQGGK